MAATGQVRPGWPSSHPHTREYRTIYFQRAFADTHSSERAVFIATAWGGHSQTGELDSELTTRVFAAASRRVQREASSGDSPTSATTARTGGAFTTRPSLWPRGETTRPPLGWTISRMQ
jgi:hypothetical protein